MIKKFRIFSQKKPFLIFWEMELLKKTSYISGGKLLSSKNEKNEKIHTEKISYIFSKKKVFLTF